MTKFIFLIGSTILLFSCNQITDNSRSKTGESPSIQNDSIKTEHTYWHKKQVIEQIIKETDSVYIIHIGIMAQAFRLERQNNPHFDKDLNLLNESLSKRIRLNIGIENGTGRILTVSHPGSDIK